VRRTASLDELRAEVLYRRAQRDLYRARAYGPRPTSGTRLRELDRRLASAEHQLAEAVAKRNAGETGLEPGE
jgi:hypothetical protein